MSHFDILRVLRMTPEGRSASKVRNNWPFPDPKAPPEREPHRYVEHPTYTGYGCAICGCHAGRPWHYVKKAG